jgi:adenylate kinase family enzyme
VYGVTGSGKSTAAQRIATQTGLPLTLADELTWTLGWVPVAGDEQRRRFAAVAAQDRWVLDTAYGAWLDVVLPRVDLVVGLDYPRWFSLQRVVRRSVMRAIDKKPICNGNTESFRAMFRRDSIIGWHFRSFSRKRGRMRGWSAAAEGPAVLLFTRARDLEVWIDTLGDRTANGATATGAEDGTETR